DNRPRVQPVWKQSHRHTKTTVSPKFHHDTSKEHRRSRRSSDMARRRPGVKGPHASQNGKANEHQWESPHLKIWRIRIFSELKQAHAFGAGDNKCRNYPDQNHSAADKGVQREFHCAIFASRGAPNRYKKIFRNDGQFVEHEQQEKVEAQKYAINATNESEVECKEFFGAG